MSAPCPVFGFAVRLTPSSSSVGGHDKMLASFAALLEASGLSAGPGERQFEFVVHREGSQTSEQDREAVLSWSGQWARVGVISVGELADLNPSA
jgi:hypothetical protein